LEWKFSFHTVFLLFYNHTIRLGNRISIENRVIEIYNRIDEFSEKNKKKLAVSLKQYWENHGKWDKGSKKQRLKVQKVKGIIGGE